MSSPSLPCYITELSAIVGADPTIGAGLVTELLLAREAIQRLEKERDSVRQAHTKTIDELERNLF